jgi:rare lipoprotein A
MRWNASILMSLLLLAGCGGGRSYGNAGPALAGGQPAGSVGARAWDGPRVQPDYPPSNETWRAADGTIRSRPALARTEPVEQPRVQPTPQWSEAQPRWSEPEAGSAPGASYSPPGEARAYTPPPPATARQDVPPPTAYADPATGASGPRGSSQPQPGETRYDEIGYAGVRPVSGGAAMDQAVVAVHRSLPANTVLEVTSLETGKTILVLVTGALEPGADHPLDLSAGAARLLGAGGETVPVRIRTVAASPIDQGELLAGRAAGERPDAPPVLLAALRKRLPGPASVAAARPAYASPAVSPPRAAPPRSTPPAVRTVAGGRYLVQVAALSNAGRAQALAQSLGGFVKPGGGLYRVQLGPFATSAQAQAARQRAAGAGYGDARVLAQ